MMIETHLFLSKHFVVQSLAACNRKNKIFKFLLHGGSLILKENLENLISKSKISLIYTSCTAPVTSQWILQPHVC